MTSDLTPPQERADMIGRGEIETSLRAAMASGALSHGWIIAGPKGAGKATLAYRIARGLLDPKDLSNEASFQMQPAARTFRLIAQGAHPDLFVAERAWNEKTSKYQTEITVETIRALTLFLNRTAAMGGYRVAIIDIADDLNRNAANALLKALEEPPANTILLLLSEAPGRLLPTIRSRCRRIDLRPVPDKEIHALLQSEGLATAKEADRITAHAEGRPGYALSLAAGNGAEAIGLAHAFLTSARTGDDISGVSAALAGKAGEDKWDIFRDVVIQRLSDAARSAARGEEPSAPLSGVSPIALAEAFSQVSDLAGRGEALNLDRAQLIQAMAYDLRAVLSAA